MITRKSAGFVYLRFEETQSAISAQRSLHGRWFAGKMITASFMVHFIAFISLLFYFLNIHKHKYFKSLFMLAGASVIRGQIPRQQIN